MHWDPLKSVSMGINGHRHLVMTFSLYFVQLSKLYVHNVNSFTNYSGAN